jgi:hypothetical protein
LRNYLRIEQIQLFILVHKTLVFTQVFKMFELLYFGSGLLFIGSLFVVYFRWFRSGSPDKLTNVSSSGESEAPEQFANNGKQESSNKNLPAKKNGGEAFGQKNEGAQLVQNEENKGNENLRYRLSAKKSKSEDAEVKTKANSTTSNASNEQQNNTAEAQQESETACVKDTNLGDVLQACETREVRQQERESEIKTNTLNVEVSDKAPDNSRISSIFDRIRYEEEAEENDEQMFVQEHVPDSLKELDNTQEEANINNAIDKVNEPLTKESNTLQDAKRKDVLIEEPLINVSQANSSESAVELQEESSLSFEGRESFKEQQNITGDLSNDLNLEVMPNEPTKPLGVVEINYPQSKYENVEHLVVDHVHVEEHPDSVEENEEIIDDNENVNFMPNEEQDISDPDVSDVRPDDVVERFSKRLSNCIIDAVLQDTQLLFSQSEDDNDQNRNKESILKFSEILAESIVKSVIDYSKVHQDHISDHDEHDRMSPSVADVIRNKPNENISPDVRDESSPTNEEEIFSADEANDDTCAGNLHEYAQKLSQQIVCDVLDLAGDSTNCSSTDAYASKLTKSVLSNAINGAKTLIGDNNSLTDSDLGVDSALDLFIAEIVGNAVESAISRVGRQTCKKTEERNGIEGDRWGQGEEHGENRVPVDREGHLGTCNGQVGEEHGDEVEDTVGRRSGHLGTCNGEIDTADEHIHHDENKHENGSNIQAVNQNGKLQSKWLSEDDLDELYDDDLSDEETSGEPSKSNSKNDRECVTGANQLTTPDEKKEFWRKSLIQDLDDELDDLDFDEIETPRSSSSSSPTKPGNLEDVMVDGSGDSDDEVLDTSKNAKVQAPINKTTDSSRSRLRSGWS